MQEETPIYSPQYRFVNRESFISRLSSNRSIDRERISGTSHNRRSLLETLDIQDPWRRSSPNKMQALEEDSSQRILRFSNQSQDLGRLSCNMCVFTYLEQYEMFEEIPSFLDNNNQEMKKMTDRHQCECGQQQCSQDMCPCSFFTGQLCIQGLCCKKCINNKNLIFMSQSSIPPMKVKQIQKQSKIAKTIKAERQNNHIKNKKRIKNKSKFQFLYCSCKKTQCMKKYCPCYAMNKECNECCVCEACQNKSDDSDSKSQKKYRMQRYGRRTSSQERAQQQERLLEQEKKIEQVQNNASIDQYFEDGPEDYSHLQMNNQMDFEPANFEEFGDRRSSNKNHSK